MSRQTYKASLERLLAPEGFLRSSRTGWTRVCDGVRESVDLHVSAGLGTTVDLTTEDLETTAFLKRLRPESGHLLTEGVSVRISQIGSEHSWWPPGDPNGPAELTEAVRVHGLPWFASVRGLDGQAARLFGRRVERRWLDTWTAWLIVTLYRLGETEEARVLLELPRRWTDSETARDRLEALRRWFEKETGRSLVRPEYESRPRGV